MNKLKQICRHEKTSTKTVTRDYKVNNKPVRGKVKVTYCSNKDCGMELKTVPVVEEE